MKPGEGKRKKPRFLKTEDIYTTIEDKIDLFFDDAEMFNIQEYEKAKKLVAKVIKKNKLCTMFMTDKKVTPLIWKALAYNIEMS